VTADPVKLAGADNGMVLISFSHEAVAQGVMPHDPEPVSAPDREIEAELKAAREEMRATIEQYETTNEELTAANEEVTSVNEELQATNEELESSKEELQSLNEELGMVNAQLDRKITELAGVSDDLRNLLKGNDVATIFLDIELRIKWFSPAVRALFDLIDTDIGRPIANFTPKFAFDDLTRHASAAIEQLVTFEQEIAADDGRHLLLRVQPYRTQDNRIAGAVATFIDISDLKAKQLAISEARNFAEAIVETVRDPLLALSSDLRVRSANSAFYAMFGITPADTIDRLIYDIVDGRLNIPPLRTLLEELIPEQREIENYDIRIEVPHLGSRSMLINARCIFSVETHDKVVLLAMEDVTDRLEAARHQDLLVGELSHRVKNTLAVVQSIAAQTLKHSTSLEIFREAFDGRLLALARANDAILDGSWKGVTLKHIIQRSIRPFAVEGRVLLADGPDIDLRPQACLALAMILHELTTNAVKYGALSVQAGSIAIAWRIGPPGQDQQIMIEWQERDGPVVVPPSRRGQGTRFIERSIAYELKGKAGLMFNPDGLHATLSMPATSAVMPKGASAPRLGTGRDGR